MNDLFLDRPTLSLMARCKQLAHALVVHDDAIKRRAAAALEGAGAEVEEIDVFKELAERARGRNEH